jgi:hypothetical protein
MRDSSKAAHRSLLTLEANMIKCQKDVKQINGPPPIEPYSLIFQSFLHLLSPPYTRSPRFLLGVYRVRFVNWELGLGSLTNAGLRFR